jgi:hypothetical protein
VIQTIEEVRVFIWKTHASVLVTGEKSDGLGSRTKSYYISYHGGTTPQEDAQRHRPYRSSGKGPGTIGGFQVLSEKKSRKTPGGLVGFNGTSQYEITTLPKEDVQLALRWWKYYKLSPARLFQEKGLLGGGQVALSFALVANFLRVAGAYRLGVSPRVRLCWGPDSLAHFVEELIKKRPSGTIFMNHVAAPAWLDTDDLASLHATNRQMRHTGYLIERSDVGRVGFIDSTEDDDDDGGGMVTF